MLDGGVAGKANLFDKMVYPGLFVIADCTYNPRQIVQKGLSTEGWIHKGGKCVCFELVRRTKLAKIPICKTQ